MKKVCVCCIGRRENRYINEFIEHYLTIGVDKIFIYDNNHGEEEHFEDVIPSNLIGDKVDIIDYRDKSFCQVQSYQECYDNHKHEYDWFLFIDIDEYLYMTGYDNIKDFLSLEKFDNYDMIHVNFMNYGDSDNVYYENKPLKERFKKPVLPLDYHRDLPLAENSHVKSIVRGGLDNVKWESTPHTVSDYLSCCDASGKPLVAIFPLVEPNWTYAHFKHYMSKTIEEWLENKVLRGYPDGNKDHFKHNDPIKDFFKMNKVTEEKLKFIEKWKKNNDFYKTYYGDK